MQSGVQATAGVKLTLGGKWMQKEREIHSLENEKEDLEQQMQAAKENIEFIEEENTILKQDLKSLQSLYSAEKKHTTSLMEQNSRLSLLCENQERQLSENRGRIAKLQDTIEQLQKNFDSEHFSSNEHSAKYKDLRKEYKLLEELQEKTGNQKVKLIEVVEKLKRNCDALQKNLSLKEKHIAVLVKDKDKLLGRVEALEGSTLKIPTAIVSAETRKTPKMAGSAPSKGVLLPRSMNSQSTKKIGLEQILKQRETEIVAKDHKIEALQRQNYNLLTRLRNKKLS